MGSTAFNFMALRFIGLATAATINFTAPFIVALLGVPMLGERVGLRRWLAIGVGFLGVLVVIRPGSNVAQLASLLALGTAVCYAGYQVLTRRVAANRSSGDDRGLQRAARHGLTTLRPALLLGHAHLLDPGGAPPEHGV